MLAAVDLFAAIDEFQKAIILDLITIFIISLQPVGCGLKHDGHDGPKVVRVFRLYLVELHGDLLLLFVQPLPHVCHERL